MRITDEPLLADFRAARRCELCGKPTPSGCDPHHNWPRGIGGGSRLDVRFNLISLCRECHTAVHLGKVSRLSLLQLVGKRERMTVTEIEDAKNELLRRPKP